MTDNVEHVSTLRVGSVHESQLALKAYSTDRKCGSQPLCRHRPYLLSCGRTVGDVGLLNATLTSEFNPLRLRDAVIYRYLDKAIVRMDYDSYVRLSD